MSWMPLGGITAACFHANGQCFPGEAPLARNTGHLAKIRCAM